MLGNSTVGMVCSNRSLAPLVRVAIPRWRDNLLAGCTADEFIANRLHGTQTWESNITGVVK